jgi:secreted trypsin-like serine protease
MSSRWISSARNSAVLCAVAAIALLLSDKAGHAQAARNDKLVPGRPAEAIRYPYVAAFSRESGDRRVYFCAGTLIAPQWIATAAHCFHAPGGQRIGTRDLWAEVGRDWLRGVGEDAQMRVVRIVIHPDYDPATQANDIALVRLDQVAGPLVADLAVREDGARTATALGFASLYEGELATQALNPAGVSASQLSDRLRQAELRTRDPSRCAGLPGEGAMASDRIICAGADPRDACVGDSGAPLVEPNEAGEDRLIGIVSLGSGCAVAEPVVAYTRVAAYADWIRNIIAAP